MKYLSRQEYDIFQWTGGPDQQEDPAWMVEAMKKGMAMVIENDDEGTFFRVTTLGGPRHARPGDWIGCGLNGHLFVVPKESFDKQYVEAK